MGQASTGSLRGPLLPRRLPQNLRTLSLRSVLESTADFRRSLATKRDPHIFLLIPTSPSIQNFERLAVLQRWLWLDRRHVLELSHCHSEEGSHEEPSAWDCYVVRSVDRRSGSAGRRVIR